MRVSKSKVSANPIWKIVVVALLGTSGMCFGQNVRVRVLNGINGLPLQDQQVAVSFLYDTHKELGLGTKQSLVGTDRNGDNLIGLPTPLPNQLAIRVHLASKSWRCGCVLLVDVPSVLEHGIAAERVSPESVAIMKSVKLKSGDVLFLARPLSWWERVLYPIERE